MAEIKCMYYLTKTRCERNTITDNETFETKECYKMTTKNRYRHNKGNKVSNFVCEKFDNDILYEFLNSDDHSEFFSKYGFLFIMSPIMVDSGYDLESYNDIAIVEVSKINKIKRRLILTNKLIKYIFEENSNHINYLDVINSLLELVSSENYVAILEKSFKYMSKIFLPIELNQIAMNEREKRYYKMKQEWQKLGLGANSFYEYNQEDTDVRKAYSSFLYNLYNTHLDELPSNEKILFEVLYTACFKILEIDENPLTGRRLNKKNERNLISIYDIDDEFISKLMQAVKMIVFYEIHYNLYESNPRSNCDYLIGKIDDLNPTFKHSTLLTAMYHALLLQSKTDKLTRICKHCGKTFTVDNVNSRREYCDNNDRCRNNANKKAQREKQKLDKKDK